MDPSQDDRIFSKLRLMVENHDFEIAIYSFFKCTTTQILKVYVKIFQIQDQQILKQKKSLHGSQRLCDRQQQSFFNENKKQE